MSRKLAVPPCGMYLGVPVYFDRGDYIFQTTGLYYSSWVSEDHDPEWYLQKVIDDNQGNLVIAWDGDASRDQLKSAAYMEDLAGIGITVPEPDWKNGRDLSPDDFPVIAEKRAERFGAGFYKFVKEAADKGLFVYSIYTNAEKQWAQKIVAEPKFLGYNAGEAFSFGSGFCETKISSDGKTAEFTLETAAEKFGDNIRNYFQVRQASGWNRFLVTSGSFHLDFEIAAGGDEIIPHMECFAFQHMNFGIALCRGIYQQCDLPLWGCYLAHEHYSFLPYASPLRKKALYAAYYLAYLNGSKITVQESGSWWQQSDHVPDTEMHHVPKYDAGAIFINRPHDYAHLVPEARKHYAKLGYDSQPCRDYRKSVSDFYDFLKRNGTPDGQPEVRFAVLKGRYDFCSQFFSPNSAVAGAGAVAEKNAFWYESTPEKTWELFRHAVLPLNDSYGEYKNFYFSGTPYGLCDIVSLMPGNLTAEYLLAHYKALMFTGWNSAREEDYQLLVDYAKGGGLLFVSIPHLSKNITRNFVSYGADELIHGGDFTELAGVKVKGRGKIINWALARDEKKIMDYPWNHHYGACFTHLGELEITGEIDMILVDDEQFQPFLIRHRCGKGEVFFLNSWEYPGAFSDSGDWADGSSIHSNGPVGELYKYLAKRARGGVWITDDGEQVGEACKKITFSYFPSTDKVYLLNCDFASAQTFFLHFHGEIRRLTLQSAEFRVEE